MAATDTAPAGSLRQLALRGGAYLAGREVAGMFVRLIGMVLTLREVGPADFGLYSSAAAYVTFATVIAQMGTEVYLIRMPVTPTKRHYDEAFTHLLISSLLVTGVSLLLTIPLGHIIKPDGTLPSLRILLLTIPLNVLWAPGQAMIERNFAYRKMGLLELGGDVVMYAVSVTLAFCGYGTWALVAGYVAWQVWLLAGSVILSGLRYRLAWSREGTREMLRHGASYSVFTTTSSVQALIVPVVVGALSGAVGVGYVSFALRIASTLAFAQRSVLRVGIAAIARARDRTARELGDAMVEGLVILMITTAIPFAGFGLVAHWVVPLVFGKEWTAALPLYTMLAVYTVLNVVNTVRYTLFFALDENMKAVKAKVLQVAIIAGFSYPLVKEFGAIGLGYASLLGLLSAVYTEWAARQIAPIRYDKLIMPTVALVPPILAPLLPFPLSLVTLSGLLLVFVVPSMRRDLVDVKQTVVSAIGRRRASGELPALSPDPLPLRDDLVPIIADAADLGGGRLKVRTVEAMLSELGWLLGNARRTSWPMLVAVFDTATSNAAAAGAADLVASTLIAELRFDDLVTAVGPDTVVAAVTLAPGGISAAEMAGRLNALVQAAVGQDAVRCAHEVVAPQSSEEADQLLRRAVLRL